MLAGRCREDGAVAFAPFTEALRPYASAAGAGLPDWVAGELARLLPELAPDAAAPEGVPQDARHRLLEAVAAVIGQAAREAPVLLVVEDLHWADPATLQMLAHVVWTVAWAPLLVAGSIRAEDAAVPALQDLLGELGRARRIVRVPVGGLAESEVGRLAGAWLGPEAAAGLAPVVHARTGGNPLFVEEVVRHLVESHPGASGAALAAAAGSDVPAGVRAVIDRRLARLAELAGTAVRVGAVAGEDFALADVAAACETSDVEVAEALEAVVATGLVDETGAAGRYRFAHALVRGAVLAWAGPTRRALAHRQLADVIATLPAERREPRIGELARHLLDARPLSEADEAARWALRAAAQATRALAYEDAAAVLARAAGAELEPGLRAEVLLALGDAQVRAGDAPAAQRSHGEAAATARALGAPELLARAALGAAGLTVSVSPIRPEVRGLLEEALAALPDDAPLRPVLLARLAIELYYEAPVTVREGLSAEALAGGRRRGGRALLEALNARHVALWSPAHTEERLAIADELIGAATEAGDREAQLQGVNWRVADLLELGELDALRAAVAEHERLAADLRLPGYLWYGPLWRAMLALMGDRPEEAERHRLVGHDLAVRAQDANGELLFTTQRLGIASAQGRIDEHDHALIRERLRESPAFGAWLTALALRAHSVGDLAATREALERGVALVPAMPLDANWLYTMTGFGAIAARLGDERGAEAIYPRLLPYGGRIVSIARGSYCTGSAQLALGVLAATLGERAAAVEHLEAAIARNDAIGAVFHAAAARGALAQATGQGDELRLSRAWRRTSGCSGASDAARPAHAQDSRWPDGAVAVTAQGGAPPTDPPRSARVPHRPSPDRRLHRRAHHAGPPRLRRRPPRLERDDRRSPGRHRPLRLGRRRGRRDRPCPLRGPPARRPRGRAQRRRHRDRRGRPRRRPLPAARRAPGSLAPHGPRAGRRDLGRRRSRDRPARARHAGRRRVRDRRRRARAQRRRLGPAARTRHDDRQPRLRRGRAGRRPRRARERGRARRPVLGAARRRRELRRRHVVRARGCTRSGPTCSSSTSSIRWATPRACSPAGATRWPERRTP